MIFARDVSNPEGPVSLPDGRWMVTEMDRGVISTISADGASRTVIVHTGRPNGLAIDGSENLWVAESQFPALLKMSMSGKSTHISRGTVDLPFLWPNDLCFGPDGAIYMTDSGILLEEMRAVDSPMAVYDLPMDGRLVRIDPGTGDCTYLDRGLRFANGIAFGPENKYLYINETLTGNIYRYPIVDGRVKETRELFSNVMVKPPEDFGQIAGPDGMAFDIEGNLYVSVLQQSDITVLAADGHLVDRLAIEGTFPTNVAFGPTGSTSVLITEGSKNQLLMLDVGVEGLPLHSP